MLTYRERSERVAIDSSIAVMVLMNPCGTDIEFWPIRPIPAVSTAPEEFVRRHLRIVGVVGLCGLKPLCAFRKPLEPRVTDGIAQAFLEYVRVLIEPDDNARLDRLYVEELRAFGS